MDFYQPNYLYLILLTVPILFIFLIYVRWTKKVRKKVFNDINFTRVVPEFSTNNKIVHFSIRMFVLILLIVSLSGPRIGTKIKTIKREGVDLIYMIDVSKSMLVEDIAPNRILKAKQIVSKSIDNLVSDRIGIIVYAGQAYPMMPLTFDYSMAKLLIKSIDTDVVPSQGTDIGSALNMASNFFDDNKKSKIIFLLTDGEDHELNFENELNSLFENNIIISSINIGTKSGGPIPIAENGQKKYKKDRKNNVIISKASSEIISQISSKTKGSFIKTTNTDEAVDFILDNMDKLDKNFSDEQFFSDYEDQFQWFLGLALLLIVFDFFLTRKKIKFIAKIIDRK